MVASRHVSPNSALKARFVRLEDVQPRRPPPFLAIQICNATPNLKQLRNKQAEGPQGRAVRPGAVAPACFLTESGMPQGRGLIWHLTRTGSSASVSRGTAQLLVYQVQFTSGINRRYSWNCIVDV